MKTHTIVTPTSDGVQVGDTSDTTSTTHWTNPSYQSEKGWECPRCHKINAPWMPQCNCSPIENWEITCIGATPNPQQWYINGSSSIKNKENITAWPSTSVTTKKDVVPPTSYHYVIEKGE